MVKITLKVMGMPFEVETDKLIPGIKEAVPQLSNEEYIPLRNELAQIINDQDIVRGLTE